MPAGSLAHEPEFQATVDTPDGPVALHLASFTTIDPPFDEAFVVKGENEPRVKMLFANPRIRELLASQPEIHLTVEGGQRWSKPKQPEGTDVLVFHVAGVIKDGKPFVSGEVQ